jgi:uncharacterized membrane protein
MYAALGMLAAVLCKPALADYVFTSIDYPGATYTETYGINNSGQIAINSSLGPKVYQSGAYIPLAAPPTGILASPGGINDAGTVVGDAYDPSGASGVTLQGFILSGGIYALFSHPGAAYALTGARGINNSGLVTGLADTGAGFAVGFIYNPANGTFTDIVPASNAAITVAQGINTAGQVVGSFTTQGSNSRTGFLRQPNGTISTFKVDNASTAARGINDNGLITGYISTANGQQAFVGDANGYQLLQCPAAVCPGALRTLAEGINNAGQIVGLWYDAAQNEHGFIATPALLPAGTTSNGSYIFSASVVGGTPIWIDPAVATGYSYVTGAGDPLFASVTLPIGIGDSLYTLGFDGMSFTLAGGVTFDFTTYFAEGIGAFEVTGIETSAGLDPANAQAFPTGLTFIGSGDFTGTMAPITSTAIPEPTTLALLAIGFAGFAFGRTRKPQ